jgi:hypothetical protein
LPSQPKAGWFEVAQSARQGARGVRTSLQAVDRNVHQPRGLDEELDQRDQALLGGKGCAAALGVFAGATGEQFGTAQSTEDALARERVEETGGVTYEREAGAGASPHAPRQWTNADNSAR